jgi:Uma2 family endonuclease
MHVPEPSIPLRRSSDDAPRTQQHRYLRAPEPVYFPDSEEVPETNENLERRIALYLSLKLELAASATIGSDQFVYWDPTTAKKRLAPDVFVRLGAPHRPFRSWKVWARGAPELGVEIISTSDEGEPDWDEKLARYRAAGVGEVVRFDADDGERPVRVWDMISGDMVERSQDDPDLRRCEALGLWWVVVKHEEIGLMVRLARDREGRDLLPTSDEQAAKAREESTKAREGEAKAREESTKARESEAKAREESTKARESEAKAREESTKARESEAKAREENERLQAEMAALRAQVVSGRAPKARKRPR